MAEAGAGASSNNEGDSTSTNSDEGIDFISLAVIDLNNFQADELRLAAEFSGHFPEADFSDIVIPEIDRSIFNESAGSRRQTYSYKGTRGRHSNREIGPGSETPPASSSAGRLSSGTGSRTPIVIKETLKVEKAAVVALGNGEDGNGIGISKVERKSTSRRISNGTGAGSNASAPQAGAGVVPDVGERRAVTRSSSLITTRSSGVHTEKNGALLLGRRQSFRLLKLQQEASASQQAEEQALGVDENGGVRSGRRHSERLLKLKISGDHASRSESSLEVGASEGEFPPLLSLSSGRRQRGGAAAGADAGVGAGVAVGVAAERVLGSENSAVRNDSKRGEAVQVQGNPPVGLENGRDGGLPAGSENFTGMVRPDGSGSLPSASLGNDGEGRLGAENGCGHDSKGASGSMSKNCPFAEPAIPLGTAVSEARAHTGRHLEHRYGNLGAFGGAVRQGGDLEGSGEQQRLRSSSKRNWGGVEEGEQSVRCTRSGNNGRVQGGGQQSKVNEFLAKRRRIENQRLMTVLEKLEGEWSGEDKSLKTAAAVGFPQGWTVQVSLRRKCGQTLLGYRNWKSPEGMLYPTFKEASTALVSSASSVRSSIQESPAQFPVVPNSTPLSDLCKILLADSNKKMAPGHDRREESSVEEVPAGEESCSELLRKDLPGGSSLTAGQNAYKGRSEAVLMECTSITDNVGWTETNSATENSRGWGTPSEGDDRNSILVEDSSHQEEKCSCDGTLKCGVCWKQYWLKVNVCREATQPSVQKEGSPVSLMSELREMVQSSMETAQQGRSHPAQEGFVQQEKLDKHCRRCICDVCGKQLASEALLVGHRVRLGHPRILKLTTAATDVTPGDEKLQTNGNSKSNWESICHSAWVSKCKAELKTSVAKTSTALSRKGSEATTCQASVGEERLAEQDRECFGAMVCTICDRSFTHRADYVSHLTAHVTQKTMKGILDSASQLNSDARSPLEKLLGLKSPRFGTDREGGWTPSVDLRPVGPKSDTEIKLDPGNFKPPITNGGMESELWRDLHQPIASKGLEQGLGGLGPFTLDGRGLDNFDVASTASAGSPFWKLLDVPSSEPGSKTL